MKKILTAILCALFAVLPLSACNDTGGDGLTKVRVNEVTHSVFYAPMYIADALGYFEEEGIEIELTNGGGADAVMAAVLSDSVRAADQARRLLPRFPRGRGGHIRLENEPRG